MLWIRLRPVFAILLRFSLPVCFLLFLIFVNIFNTVTNVWTFSFARIDCPLPCLSIIVLNVGLCSCVFVRRMLGDYRNNTLQRFPILIVGKLHFSLLKNIDFILTRFFLLLGNVYFKRCGGIDFFVIVNLHWIILALVHIYFENVFVISLQSRPRFQPASYVSNVCFLLSLVINAQAGIISWFPDEVMSHYQVSYLIIKS